MCSWFNYDEQRKKACIQLCWMYNDWNVSVEYVVADQKCFIVTETDYFVHLTQITIRIHHGLDISHDKQSQHSETICRKCYMCLAKLKRTDSECGAQTAKHDIENSPIASIYHCDVFQSLPNSELLKTLQLAFNGLWEVCNCCLCCFDWHLAQNSNSNSKTLFSKDCGLDSFWPV